jgi:hypothetical protein
MHQQRVRIHAKRRRLGIKNRPFGRAHKSKPTPTDSFQFHRAYSPLIALLAEFALTQQPTASSPSTSPTPNPPNHHDQGGDFR